MDKRKGKHRSEIEQEISNRAWEDPHFKKKLMANPREALKEMGIKVPEFYKINIHEEKENNIDLVIRRPRPDTSHMNPDELKKASGGWGLNENASCPF